MEFIPVLLAFVIGLAGGGVLVWIGIRAALRDKDSAIASLIGERDAAKREENAARDRAAGLRADLARRESDLDNERRAAAEKLDLLEKAEQKLREAFRSLSAEALKSNNESFLELARTSLEKFQESARTDLESRQKAVGDLVKPIGDSLGKVDEQLKGLETKRVEAYAELREQVRQMAESQQKLETETGNLVKALRSPSVRGRWGEIQLKRVVEMAGMIDHCDFFEQKSTTSEEGRLRPDLLVRLPGGKNIIVDAKVPLEGYLEGIEADTDEAREACLADHARQVRDHMTKLGNKGYWGQFDPAPEFVVMFLPGENLFHAALRHDPALIEYGVDQRVIPASPITLIALLRAVAFGWKQERIAKGAQEISRLGRELFDRIRVVATHCDDLRAHLDRTVHAYNRMVGSLESRVLVTARRFQELGAAGTEELPDTGPVETSPRSIQAEDLVALPGGEQEQESEE